MHGDDAAASRALAFGNAEQAAFPIKSRGLKNRVNESLNQGHQHSLLN